VEPQWPKLARRRAWRRDGTKGPDQVEQQEALLQRERLDLFEKLVLDLGGGHFQAPGYFGGSDWT
jgi:hypothetical protein